MDCNSHRNKLRRAPFTARLRACSEPNNLAIVWPNPYTTMQNKNTPFGTFLFWWEYACINRAENKQEFSDLMQQVKEFKEKWF